MFVVIIYYSKIPKFNFYIFGEILFPSVEMKIIKYVKKIVISTFENKNLWFRVETRKYGTVIRFEAQSVTEHSPASPYIHVDSWYCHYHILVTIWTVFHSRRMWHRNLNIIPDRFRLYLWEIWKANIQQHQIHKWWIQMLEIMDGRLQYQLSNYCHPNQIYKFTFVSLVLVIPILEEIHTASMEGNRWPLPRAWVQLCN